MQKDEKWAVSHLKAAPKLNTVRWLCGIEARSRLSKLATAIGSDLVLAGVRQRSATFTPQKLPKAPK
jgi:hypothetical protein